MQPAARAESPEVLFDQRATAGVAPVEHPEDHDEQCGGVEVIGVASVCLRQATVRPKLRENTVSNGATALDPPPPSGARPPPAGDPDRSVEDDPASDVRGQQPARLAQFPDAAGLLLVSAGGSVRDL